MRIDPLLTWNRQTGAVRHVTDALLAEIYLAPKLPEVDIAELLVERTAPWSECFGTAPDETTHAVEAALVTLAHSTPRISPEDIQTDLLAEGRARTHLAALKSLWADIGHAPAPLAIWAHVLGSAPEAALEPLPLLDPTPCKFATPAETALARTLLTHHGAAPKAFHDDWRARQPIPGMEGTSALHRLQSTLGQSAEGAAMDASVACYGLRDPRDEAEFCAAFAQRMLDDGTVASASEIGVLAPDDESYQSALREAFHHVGLTLSGGQVDGSLRDIGSELLSLLLVVLEGPAPRTAKASICVSPLMPWSRETGRRMARDLIDRGWSRAASELTGPAREVWDALRPCTTPEQLFARLGAVVRAVPEAGLNPLVASLRAAVEDRIDWPLLRRIAAPRPATIMTGDRFVEGISLFSENALPWRSARQLIVLGLAGRHWPRLPGADPFFTEGEITQVRATGLALPGRREKLARGLDLFRRQLGAATDRVTLLVPAMDMRGDRLSPSIGFSLIAHMLGAKEPADLVHDVRSDDQATWPVPAHLAAPVPLGGRPSLPTDGLLHLNRGLSTPDKPGLDLWRLRDEGSDNPSRQSPSRLETLLVSPLAWLLDELGAKDRTWAPESLDVMTLGTILHQVLEDTFPEHAGVPDAETLLASIPGCLDAAIARHASWLAAPQWATERQSLLREAKDVATDWAGFLEATGAEVLHNEIMLSGDHGGILLHGKADCLLRLPDERILVIDHKRSKAAGRRERMTKGWDLQVALYRAMLERPTEETPLTRLVADGAQVVTAYHTMLDSTVLSDTSGAGIDRMEATGADASANAMDHLAALIAEVGAGTIRLNRGEDVKAFKDRGITAYALKDNAFVATFTLPSEDEA